MADATGYGALRQPAGGYAASQNPPSLYAANSPQQQAAAPAAAASPAPITAAPRDAQKEAEAMQAVFAKMYLDKFFGGKANKALRVGRKIPIELVSDEGMEAALKKQVDDVIERMLQARFDYNLPGVEERLRKYYKDTGGKYPYEGTHPTKAGLSKVERGILVGAAEGGANAGIKDEASRTAGIYVRPADRGGTGKMIIRKSAAEDPRLRSRLAGDMAHELAHAYADPIWWDFYDLATANFLSRTGELNEGIAVHFEEILSRAWWEAQPGDTEIPIVGYRDEPKVAQTGVDFLNAVGKQAAYEAFFGGWISIADPNDPANTINVGQKKKRWKWQWKD